MFRYDTRSDKVIMVLVYLSLVLLALVMIFPFWDQLVTSLSTRYAALRGGFRLFPWPMDFGAYRLVFASKELNRAFLNTFLRVLVGTAWSVFFNALTAYPLSRDDYPLRRLMTLILLFSMFFSGGLIPSYLLRRDLHLINNPLVLILPGVAAFNVIIMRNFVRSIPHEIHEAARLDGASDFQILFQVVLPLSAPVLATIALWSAVGHWNAYFDVLIYMTDRSKYTIQIILRRVLLENFLGSASMDPATAEAQFKAASTLTPEVVKAALLIVSTVPILVVYPFAQRYFIRGITLGAVKG